MGYLLLLGAVVATFGAFFLVGYLLRGEGDWMCGIGVHDWRDGPGQPCVLCGREDVLGGKR